ncbi:MAG: alpha-mannosidase [Armatimonadota bacterium]
MPSYQIRIAKVLPRLRDHIYAASYTVIAPLSWEAWRTKEPVPYSERMSGEPIEAKVGENWGELFDCAWFHLSGTVPAEAAGQQVVLLIDLGGEGLVVDADGNPVIGTTNVKAHIKNAMGCEGKRVVPFANPAKGGETVDIWMDAGANSLFGAHGTWGPYKQPNIAIKNPQMAALYYDFEVLLDLYTVLPEGSARKAQILTSLCDVFQGMRHFNEVEAEWARGLLAPELTKKGGDATLTIGAGGHAHIDLAWLWPIRETIRKGARTFATALRMMERYPDYVFVQSQPQVYEWMEQHYPSVYAEIEKRVAEGRWEPLGGLWVEIDTNLPCGESLVRQLLYGKNYFREKFGIDSKIVWLPDSFGYTGSLPQVMKLAGIELFVTQKLSWDSFKTYPHHSFWWSGIDGSEVMTHLLPEDTYNGSATPTAAYVSEQRYIDKGVSEAAYMAFGIGDGGGGPGEEHLERLQRIGNLLGLPRVKQEWCGDFLTRFAKDAHRFERWQGELYLAHHQGTYTTQARNKKWNRKIELMLRDCEMLSSWANSVKGLEYPKAELEKIWKEVLLYQFHDIIPGSSITRVYDESRERYAAMAEQVCALTSTALTSLGQSSVGVFNSQSWLRSEWVKTDGGWQWAQAPSCGFGILSQEAIPEVTATETLLENELVRAEFDASGNLISMFDKKTGFEALEAPSNQLRIYDDYGDAWDFPIWLSDQMPQYMELVEQCAYVDGPQAVLKQVRRYCESSLTQWITLTAGSASLEFRTECDWKDAAKQLRADFDTTIHTNAADCEIQFGTVQRPTHQNTVWEYSMFEVCAHRWVDLSERSRGVAVLNDCKYGHAFHQGQISLHLLRTPGDPDPVADRAQHSFTYALYPHAGDYVQGKVRQAAHELNSPLRVLENGSKGSLLTLSSASVYVEAIKRAEDGDGLIVRLYEGTGADVDCLVTCSLPVSSATIVNLMEEPIEGVEVQDGAIALSFRPFEIKSLRLR